MKSVNNEKKLQIFVSSTYKDMLEEREAAIETILQTHNIPAGMELFSSGSESQLETIKEWINDSDLYVLILGGRYGSLEPKSQKSYTQLEYEYAIEIGKPYFAIVISEDFLDEKVKSKGTKVIEIENSAKYQEFRKSVLEKICVFYKNIDDLKYKLSTNIENTAKKHDFSGWIRGKTLSDYIEEDKDDILLSNVVFSEIPKDNTDFLNSKELKELCNMYFSLCKPLLNFSEILSNDFPVMILAEIRNVFEHFSRLIITENDIELKKMRSHIYKLCIDSYNIAVINFNDTFNKFEKNSRNFKGQGHEFFGKYYALKTEFTNLVIEAKNHLSYETYEDVFEIYQKAFDKGYEIYMLIGKF